MNTGKLGDYFNKTGEYAPKKNIDMTPFNNVTKPYITVDNYNNTTSNIPIPNIIPYKPRTDFSNQKIGTTKGLGLDPNSAIPISEVTWEQKNALYADYSNKHIQYGENSPITKQAKAIYDNAFIGKGKEFSLKKDILNPVLQGVGSGLTFGLTDTFNNNDPELQMSDTGFANIVKGGSALATSFFPQTLIFSGAKQLSALPKVYNTIANLPKISKVFSIFENPVTRNFISEVTIDTLVNSVTSTPAIIANGIKEGKKPLDIVFDVAKDDAFNIVLSAGLSKLTQNKTIKNAYNEFLQKTITKDELESIVRHETLKTIKPDAEQIYDYIAIGKNENRILEKARNLTQGVIDNDETKPITQEMINNTPFNKKQIVIKFKEQLQKIENGVFDKAHSHVVVTETPEVFVEKAGLPKLPLAMRYDAVYLAIKDLGEIKGNYHKLGIDIMSQIPNALENPLYILKSKIPNRVEAILKLTDKQGKQILVSVEFNTSGLIEGKNKPINLIVTAFGPKNQYLEKKIQNSKILYKNIEELSSQVSPRGQFPSTINDLNSSNNSITNNSENVNNLKELYSNLKSAEIIRDKKWKKLTPQEKAEFEKFKKDLREIRLTERGNAEELSKKLIENMMLLGNGKYRDIITAEINLKQIKNEIKTAIYEGKTDLEDWAKDLTANSDTWKDKGSFHNMNNTMERNSIAIMGEKDGKRVNDELFWPIHENEGKRIVWLEEARKFFKTNKLSKKEREWTQKLLEGLIPIEDIPNNLNIDKIQKATYYLKEFYDNTLDTANEILLKNGYPPIPKRSNYSPHFIEENPILKQLGIYLDVTNLPTDINGLTHTFKPGKNWFGNSLKREGDTTTYDAVQGFDKYIEGISKVIYHTDDIQRLRAFDKQLRMKYTTPEIRARIDEITANPDIPIHEKAMYIDGLLKDGKTHLSNYVSNLTEYTNVLAGKKDLADRAMERMLGRQAYNATNFIINRVAKNMVAINPGTWLTQFIPVTMGLATTKKKAFLDGIMDTMKALYKDDGFRYKSAFLSARPGSDILTKGVLDKVGDKLSSPMRWIDNFTSNVIVRSKYLEGLQNGLTENAALKKADEYASALIGDRSLGGMPTLYNQRNPLTKIATQFQLEVNNQLQFIFKDLPREYINNPENKKNIAGYVSALGQIAFYSYLFNQAYETLNGNRPAFDPLGVALNINDSLNNKNTSNGQKVEAVSGSILKQLPYIGSFLGGGRIPVSSGIPDLQLITTGKADLIKELSKPAYYIAPPFGGSQLKKTIEGVTAYNKGGSMISTKDGDKMRFPIPESPGNAIKTAIFGQYATKEARDYFDNYKTPLSVEQTKGLNYAKSHGINSTDFYNAIQGIRDLKPENGRKGVTDIQKRKYLATLFKGERLKLLIDLLVDTEKGKKLIGSDTND